MTKKHLFDATNVVLTVKKHETEGLVKLGFYLLCFFYYLYRYGNRSAPAFRNARVVANDRRAAVASGVRLPRALSA